MEFSYQDSGERRTVLDDVQRVVVKVGTRLLTDAGQPAAARVHDLVSALAEMRSQGVDVILVSSGAVGTALSMLELPTRPAAMPDLQALAAVGQTRLMALYESACVAHGFHCGQLLLTAADLQERDRHLNVASCFRALLARGFLPIINENDSVSVDEIRVGDNDVLAAMVAAMLRADLTVVLTTVDGMHDAHPDAAVRRRVSVVTHISDAVAGMAGGTDGNAYSVGGMSTKLRAAGVVTRAGEPLWIADGTDFSVLRSIWRGEDVGTLFLPLTEGRMRAHKRFLAFFSEPTGDVWVDAGAACAVRERGTSLLPRGVTRVDGVFGRGDTVRIRCPGGDEVGRGISNYSSADAARIIGLRSADIRAVLPSSACYDEVIHRDHLVLTRANRDAVAGGDERPMEAEA